MRSTIISSNFEQPLAFAKSAHNLFVLCRDPENQTEYEPFAMQGNWQVIAVNAKSGGERVLAREVSAELMTANETFVACASQNHVLTMRHDGSERLELHLPTLIRAILLDGETLYVAHKDTRSQGDPGVITAIGLQSGEISRVCSVPLVTIQALAASESALYFHTGQNFYRLAKGSDKPQQYLTADEGIRAHAHGGGFLYFVTSAGITSVADGDKSCAQVAEFQFGPCRIMHAIPGHLLVLSPRYRSVQVSSGETRESAPTIWRVSLDARARVDAIYTLETEPPPAAGSDFRDRLARSRRVPRIVGMEADGGDILVCSSQGEGSIQRIFGALSAEPALDTRC